MLQHAWLLPAVLVMSAPIVQAQSVRPVSAPISNVRYQLRFDSALAARHTIHVRMTFDVAGSAPVLLSLPMWTPGAYEAGNFARYVSNFSAAAGDDERPWDKLDYDTWRIRPARAGTITVAFDYLAEELDNAKAWATANFVFVNGTNVLPYAEGRSLDFAARVSVVTENGWRVATGLHATAEPNTFAERNYHDLVDMPLAIGRFDVDSVQISGKWTRLVTYPAGVLAGAPRQTLWRQMNQFITAQGVIFGGIPWDDYTQFIVFTEYPGISALEHQSSNLAISHPQFIGSEILTNILAHEVVHAWNVKRLRPAEMVPYRYDVPQQTTLLWISEGFTNYYGDLSSVRGGAIDSTEFLTFTNGHIETIRNTPDVSVEDASLSIWIHPTDGTDAIYYDKGSIIGLLLDIQIRDASDNRRSLDDVMRSLYQATWPRGRGFSNAEFWAAVTRAAGRPLDTFYQRYVDGRDSLPFDSVLPLGGLRLVTQTFRVPRMGVQTNTDSTGSLVVALVPGGAFETAGVRVGDYLLAVGGIDQSQDVQGDQFRRQFAGREGERYPIVVRREGQQLTLTGTVRMGDNVVTQLQWDAQPSARASRIRSGILRGTVDQ